LQQHIFDQVNKICDAFTGARHISVSSNARELIATIISAIEQDPHPAWRDRSPEQLRSFQALYLQRIPTILEEIITTEKVKSQITTFDVLHWAAGPTALARGICLIPKG
jgi:hypothetical protein